MNNEEQRKPERRISDTRHEYTAALLVEAEMHRRERTSMDAYPLTQEHDTVVDYAQSGNAIELANGHLRESIPNGQRLRTETAFEALRMAVLQQGLWLRKKGYTVNV